VRLRSHRHNAREVAQRQLCSRTAQADSPCRRHRSQGWRCRSGGDVTLQVADAILALATLSYLGLGMRPPASDWGDMIAGGIRYIYDGYGGRSIRPASRSSWPSWPSTCSATAFVTPSTRQAGSADPGLWLSCAESPGPGNWLNGPKSVPVADGRPLGRDAASLLVSGVAGRGSSMVDLTDAMRAS